MSLADAAKKDFCLSQLPMMMLKYLSIWYIFIYYSD